MATVLETMQNKFPQRAFDRNLLKQFIKNTKDSEYGPDQHRLPEQFEMAKNFTLEDLCTRLVMTLAHFA